MEDLNIQLDFKKELADELLKIEPTAIREIYPNPTLIEIPGETEEYIFLSTLLHGNEQSSFFVLQKLCQRLKEEKPKRGILIFVGNVWATEKRCRILPHQEDYNRIWKEPLTAEGRLASKVLHYAKTKNLFASIDIHNNSGNNPFYACVNKLDLRFLNLAKEFSKMLVYFENPNTVLSMAMASICPSTTIECGRSGNQEGIDRAFEFVWTILQTKDLNQSIGDELRVYQTVGRMIPLSNIHFGEEEEQGEVGEEGLVFPSKIDHLNFSMLKKGSVFAKQNGGQNQILVLDENKNDISSDFFELEGDSLVLIKDVVPSMLTQDLSVIYQDCLGYLMDEIPLDSIKL